MESVEEFLVYTMKLEEEAALRFAQLADAMVSSGNCEVGKLFRRLSGFSRMHYADAKERAGLDVPQMQTEKFNWPDIESPETAAIWAADPFIGREQALEIALEAECASLDYYRSILDSTQDAEIKACAREFVGEESHHVAELIKWIGTHHASEKRPFA